MSKSRLAIVVLVLSVLGGSRVQAQQPPGCRLEIDVIEPGRPESNEPHPTRLKHGEGLGIEPVVG